MRRTDRLTSITQTYLGLGAGMIGWSGRCRRSEEHRSTTSMDFSLITVHEYISHNDHLVDELAVILA